MPKREVDKRKTARALRKLRRAAERASGEGAPELTNWEKEFVEGVSGRLEKYGSAFRDPGKGKLEEALSQRQAHVVRMIDKKSRGKTAGKTAGKVLGKALDKSGDDAKPPRGGKVGGLSRSEFKRKTPMGQRTGPRVRDVNEDVEAPVPEPVLTPEQKRAALRVVRGGKAGGKHG
jgi:hypothetical protein